MSKKDKKSKLTYPRTIHVINLGSDKNPDFITSTDPKHLLDEWDGAKLVGTYELVGTDKMQLIQTLEIL